MSERARVIIADDHPLFLEGVQASLQPVEDMLVIGTATDAAGALDLAREHLPELAVLDVTMPGSGLQAARDIGLACPATKIVMLTVSDNEDDLLAALKAGASGYVLKGVSPRELIGVLRAILAGEVYVSPAVAGRLLGEMTKRRGGTPLDELSPRERDVLKLLADGLSNQEIGQRLNLAEKTVKHYMTNILAKLQVRSRVEAALMAQRAGLAARDTRGS